MGPSPKRMVALKAYHNIIVDLSFGYEGTLVLFDYGPYLDPIRQSHHTNFVNDISKRDESEIFDTRGLKIF